MVCVLSTKHMMEHCEGVAHWARYMRVWSGEGRYCLTRVVA